MPHFRIFDVYHFAHPGEFPLAFQGLEHGPHFLKIFTDPRPSELALTCQKRSSGSSLMLWRFIYRPICSDLIADQI
jgi:hypothetical protein